MNTERQHWAIDRAYHWWNVVNDVHNASIEDCPIVTFSNRMTSAAGIAFSRSNKIVLSNLYLEDVPPQKFDQVIGHEIAHIFADRFYQRRCKHSVYWQVVMRNIGLSPERCHQYDRVVPKRNIIKLLIKCPNCNIFYRFSRNGIIHLVEGTRTYCCRKCTRSFDPSDPIVVKHSQPLQHA